MLWCRTLGTVKTIFTQAVGQGSNTCSRNDFQLSFSSHILYCTFSCNRSPGCPGGKACNRSPGCPGGKAYNRSPGCPGGKACNRSPGCPGGKASASKAADLGSISAFATNLSRSRLTSVLTIVTENGYTARHLEFLQFKSSSSSYLLTYPVV